MVDINDFNLFDLVGLGNATGLEWIFGISALLGGILFLLWFVLMLIGGVAEGVFEGLFGLEIDVMSSDASFKALTFQGVMAFMLFFGLAGLWVLKSDGSDPIAVAAGGIAGTASMYGTAKLFEVFMAMQSTGNVDIKDTVGAKGQVYLIIPHEGVGQVQIETNGSLSTYNARSHDRQEISTGRLVQVVDTMGEVLLVERI
ncbi:MAG: hypothetical protein L7R66_02665 [Candidatus Thalassarchaeaceae archaeon]|nr:hypothetical protein [Candidatus Thalassarchaeaceae archaeon]